MDSRVYWIWLQRALPLGWKKTAALLETFGHAAGVYEAGETALRQFGVGGAMLSRLTDKDLTAARRILNRVLELGDWVLTPQDALYPVGLRRLSSLPVALYCRGTLPDLDTHPAIAVVGTRHATVSGRQEARALSAGLAAGGMVVVSGCAVGIDAAVHEGALLGQGSTIGVLACPLNVEYPDPNTALRRQIVASGGLLISEYPPDEPYKCDFHVRNRLLAGLSQGVCLAETPARSGARITARLAAEYGRDVYAMPGALSGHHNDGAHKEIQKGATLVIRATDVLLDYESRFPSMLHVEKAEETQKKVERQRIEDPAPPRKEKKPRRTRKKEAAEPPAPPAPPAEVTTACPAGASAAAQQVFEALTAQPRPVDELALQTGLPIPIVLAALTELEMFGCAANSAGQQYRRV